MSVIQINIPPGQITFYLFWASLPYWLTEVLCITGYSSVMQRYFFLQMVTGAQGNPYNAPTPPPGGTLPFYGPKNMSFLSFFFKCNAKGGPQGLGAHNAPNPDRLPAGDRIRALTGSASTEGATAQDLNSLICKSFAQSGPRPRNHLGIPRHSLGFTPSHTLPQRELYLECHTGSQLAVVPDHIRIQNQR